MTSSSFAHKLLFSALCTAATALTASATPLSVKLVNAGSPADIASSVTIDGVTKFGVYIGPYTLSINGGANTLAMCIDFNIVSNVGSTYNAYETGVGSSNLANTYAPTKGQEYEEEAYLFSQITQTGISNSTRTAIQEAAWDITAYGITNSSYKYLIGNNSYINTALADYSSMANVGYEIISDTTKNGEQEFITYSAPAPSSVTPEPSSLVLMLAPALLFGAEALRRHKLKQSFQG